MMEIKKTVVKIYQKICTLTREVEFRQVKATTKILNYGKHLHLDGNVCVLIPHADDEWVGCSQILHEHSAKTELLNMNMAGGDSAELHKVRYKELNIVANEFGLPLITMGNTVGEKISLLTTYILEKKPCYIALPFFYDWHDEHIAVMQMLKETLLLIEERDACLLDNIRIIMYQVSVPVPQERITHYCEMDKKTHQKKWNFLDCVYQTQKNIPWSRFRYHERINGKRFRCYAAEVYVMENAVSWKAKVDREILTESERRMVLKNLQSVTGVRKTIRRLRGEDKCYEEIRCDDIL